MTDSGIVISVKLVHPLKTDIPIVFIELGIVILTSEVQSLKVKQPSEVTDEGIVI